MLDSPLALVLPGISATSAIASFRWGRRRTQPRPPEALAVLTDHDFLTALAVLQPVDDSSSIVLERRASRALTHSISVMHSPSRMRDANHPTSVSWAIEQDHDVYRRLTLLVIGEIQRRGLQRPSH